MFIARAGFTTETYAENRRFREQNKIVSIYGSCIRIADQYPPGCSIMVVEMNNDTNTVEGIGHIYNLASTNMTKGYKIHTLTESNWTIYSGKRWISGSKLEELDPVFFEQLELMLFYGRSHLKRLAGVAVMTEHIFRRWGVDRDSFVKRADELLKLHGTSTTPLSM